MGKQQRQSNRENERLIAAEEALRAAHRRRVIPYWIGAGVLLIAVVSVLVVTLSSGGNANGLPQGTQTFTVASKKHVTGAVHYDQNPPIGGDHSATWLNCGVYPQPVPNVNAVHDLEHGAVWITYRPGLSATGVHELQQYVEANYDGPQRYLVLSPYPGLPAPVVASAWGAQIRLSGPGDPRLAAFELHYVGGNQGGEQGALCTGGIGKPIG